MGFVELVEVDCFHQQLRLAIKQAEVQAEQAMATQQLVLEEEESLLVEVLGVLGVG